MSRFRIIILALAGIGVGRLLWGLHPWMPPGSSVFLGRWEYGEFEFQVWQRKNHDVFEPFADGLFVRRGANAWAVFCFDIQDQYSPRVKLAREGSEVVVYREGEVQGRYDLTTQLFRRQEVPTLPGYIDREPPGDWWVRR